jgi:hypothetical protein
VTEQHQRIVDAVRLLASLKTHDRNEFWKEAFEEVGETHLRIRVHREVHLENACYHCFEVTRDFYIPEQSPDSLKESGT